MREVAPDHSTYDRLAYALSEQDRWGPREHAAFWTGLLPEVPHRGRRGRRSNVDVISRAASALRGAGLTRSEVENVLAMAPGTVRAGEPDTARRSRPSFERGDQLRHQAQEGTQGDALRRMTGSSWVPEEALPRVWRYNDEEPRGGHFNTLIAVDWQPPGVDVALATEEELRRRWYQRRAAEGGGEPSE